MKYLVAAFIARVASSQLWNETAPAGLASFDYGSYPSLTGDYYRAVFTAQVHAHNQYWNDVPLLSALAYGCTSIEADVWLVNGTLYIGHDVASLRQDRTFASLYINPLVTILDQKNPSNEFTKYAKDMFNYTELNGVYDTSAGTSLNLLVDVKTDGATTWPYVVAALEPLRAKGYLSYVNASDTAIRSKPVTVIGTGNTPLPYLLARPNRDYFFDAPLAALNSTFVKTLSPLASTSFRNAINWDGKLNATASQIGNMTRLITQARSQGLTTRFWDNPTWPIYARDAVWRTLIELGSDYLNADDLAAATSL